MTVTGSGPPLWIGRVSRSSGAVLVAQDVSAAGRRTQAPSRTELPTERGEPASNDASRGALRTRLDGEPAPAPAARRQAAAPSAGGPVGRAPCRSRPAPRAAGSCRAPTPVDGQHQTTEQQSHDGREQRRARARQGRTAPSGQRGGAEGPPLPAPSAGAELPSSSPGAACAQRRLGWAVEPVTAGRVRLVFAVVGRTGRVARRLGDVADG